MLVTPLFAFTNYPEKEGQIDKRHDGGFIQILKLPVYRGDD